MSNLTAKELVSELGLSSSRLYQIIAKLDAANNEVQLLSFLDSPEALAAKKEAENGQVKTIGSLADFNDLVDQLDEN